MKYSMKFLLTIVCLMSSIMVKAYDFEIDGIYYDITSEAEKTVKVESDMDEEGNNKYTGVVVIPSSVTHNNTTYSVTEIGYNALCGSSELTSVTIPSSIIEIGDRAFSYCDSLKEINVDSDNRYFSSKDGVLFNKNQTVLIKYPDAYGASYEIPSSVTEIGSYAFEHCIDLTSVVIPNSVEKIGKCAFDSCSGLTSIVIPDSVIRICDEAFIGCTGLTDVTIPSSVIEIGEAIFFDSDSLKEINVDSDNRYFSSKDGVLFNKNQTTLITYPIAHGSSYEIPSGVTEIGSFAFIGCTGLTSVVMSSVEKIGKNAFGSCRGLASVVISGSVTKICDEAFIGCTGLTDVTIPRNVTSIGRDAFAFCANLATVNFNAINCESMGDPNPEYVYPVFRYCPLLTTVNIGDDITKIPDFAFCYISNLTTVNMPDGITSIGAQSFYGSGLTSFVIPNGVREILDGAFFECSGMTSVTIPNSVMDIHEDAFRSCTSLKEIINYNEHPQTIDKSTFEGVDKVACMLYVPTGSLSAYKAAPEWSDFLKIEEFDPSGVAEVKESEVKVISADGIVTVTGASDASQVAVFSITGQLVSLGNDKTIRGLDNGMYIVKVAGKSEKVVVKQ